MSPPRSVCPTSWKLSSFAPLWNWVFEAFHCRIFRSSRCSGVGARLGADDAGAPTELPPNKNRAARATVIRARRDMRGLPSCGERGFLDGELPARCGVKLPLLPGTSLLCSGLLVVEMLDQARHS